MLASGDLHGAGYPFALHGNSVPAFPFCAIQSFIDVGKQGEAVANPRIQTGNADADLTFHYPSKGSRLPEE